MKISDVYHDTFQDNLNVYVTRMNTIQLRVASLCSCLRIK